MPKDRSGLALFIFSFFGIDPGSEGRPERCTGGALYLIIDYRKEKKKEFPLPYAIWIYGNEIIYLLIAERLNVICD